MEIFAAQVLELAVSPMTSVMTLLLAAVIIVLVILIIGKGVVIIKSWERGIAIRLGKFVGVLDPGLHVVAPFITNVYKIDLRTQVVDVPPQDVITKDNSPVKVDAVIYYRVIDPVKAFFEVSNYKVAIVALAQTTLRSVIGDMTLDEILYNRAAINAKLRQILDEATDKWGVRVEAVEIKEVEPSPRVVKAMEEQTAAERERRAAILRADGERRAAILRAEGEKRAMILRAEGVRAQKILEAEGERLATILKALGEAQRLRIIGTGALALNPQALAVLNLEMLEKLGRAPSTKYVLPLELTNVLRALSAYVGAGAEKPPELPKPEQIKEIMSRIDELIGKVPSYTELMEEVKKIREEAGKLESPKKALSAEEEKRLLEGAAEGE